MRGDCVDIPLVRGDCASCVGIPLSEEVIMVVWLVSIPLSVEVICVVPCL